MRLIKFNVKRSLLRILLFFAIFALSPSLSSAQEFYCYLNGDRFSFDLVTDQIFLKTNQPYTQTQLKSFLPKAEFIRFDLSDNRSIPIHVIQLNPGLGNEDLSSLINELNQDSHVALASALIKETESHEMAGMSNQLIVKLAPERTLAELNSFCEQHGIQNKRLIPRSQSGYYVLQIPKEKINEQLTLVNTFTENTLFASIEPSLVRFLKPSTNDPLFSQQYAHDASHVNTVGAWTQMGGILSGGSPGITVAIIDCGVQLNHPDLVNNMATGFDATYNSGSGTGQTTINTNGGPALTDTYNHHGTACAGVVGAQGDNSIGIAGIAYKCKIYPVRIGYMQYSSTLSAVELITDDVILTSGIADAAAHADILSISWGTALPSAAVGNAIFTAVQSGRASKGCPVLCAAGNDNSTIIPFPARLPEVICVGATDATDNRAAFSNYSIYLDVAAPGKDIMTTDLTGSNGNSSGDYVTLSGTSFAAPYAAGLMALILSISPGTHQLTARSLLESNCTKTGGYSYTTNNTQPAGTWSNELGYGRINAQATIAEVLLNSVVLPNPTGTALVTVNTTFDPKQCYGGAATFNPSFKLNLTGGNQFNWSSPGVRFIAVKFWADAAHTIPSPLIGPDTFLSINQPGLFPGLQKTLYLNCTSISSFPATINLFLDIITRDPVTNGVQHQFHPTPVTIIIDRAPQFSFNPINVCPTTHVTPVSYLNNTFPGTTWTWNMGGYTNVSTSNPMWPVIMGVMTTQTISLTQTNVSGCSRTMSVAVNVVNLNINTSGWATPQKHCSTGAPFQIGPATNISGGSGSYSFNWNNAYLYPGLSSSTVKNPTLNPALSTGPGLKNYSLTVTDANYGCFKTVGFPVLLGSNAQSVNVTSDINNHCPGKIVKLTANLMQLGSTPVSPSATYTGGFKRGTTSLLPWLDTVNVTPATQYQALDSPMTTTTYQFLVNDDYGCPSTANYTVNIIPGSLTASAGPDIKACASPLKTITATASGGTPPYTFYWLHQVYSPTITVPNLAATYFVQAKDAQGCKVFDTVKTTPTTISFYGLDNDYYFRNAGTAFSPPSVQYYTSTSGGTPPYSYLWSPAQYFVNPTSPSPTTVPLGETHHFTVKVTDANGCEVIRKHNLMAVVGQKAPMEIFPETDFCSTGNKIVVIKHTGGMGCIGDSVRPSLYHTPPIELVRGKEAPNASYDASFPVIPKTYSFTPAPLSVNGDTAVFAPSVSSVSINVNQAYASPTPGYPGPFYQVNVNQSYSFNYTFPQADNSRNNLLPLLNNRVMYVGTDQLLYIAVSNATGTSWASQSLTPATGWGNVRVEGWLAMEPTGQYIFFKGTDQKLHYLNNTGGSWSLNLAPTGVDVRSDIIYRADGFYYIGTDSKIHRFSIANGYVAVNPTGGYGTVLAAGFGSLTSGTAATSNIAFWGNDGKTYYLMPASGNFTLNLVSANPNAGETLMSNNGDLYTKNPAGKIELFIWQAGLQSYFNFGALVCANDPNYTIDGFMAKGTGDHIFYKGNDNTIYNFYPSSSTLSSWHNWPLTYTMNIASGDVKLLYPVPGSNPSVVCIAQDKKVYMYQWSAQNWVYKPISRANAKRCSGQFSRSAPSPGCVDLDLSASSVRICQGSGGQLSVFLPQGVSPTKYSVKVYESINNTLVYSGQPNTTIPITPSASCTYSIVLTHTATHCSSTSFYEVTVNGIPTANVLGSASSVCLGGNAALHVNLPESEAADNYSIRVYDGARYQFVYNGPVTTSYPVTPGANTPYEVQVVNNITGCQQHIPHNVTVTNDGPDINLSGSTEITAKQGRGFISAYLKPHENPELFALTVTGSVEAPLYSGKPNVAIEVFPAEPTEYQVQVTNLATGCLSRVTHFVQTMDHDPSFTASTNPIDAEYYKLTASVNDKNAAETPGFNQAWYLREVDMENNSIAWTASDPECWRLPLHDLNTFKGVTTNQPYTGTFSDIDCNRDGFITGNKTYILTRTTWNDFCDRKEYHAIIRPDQYFGKTRLTTAGINTLIGDDTPTLYPNPSTGSIHVRTGSNEETNLVVFDIIGQAVFATSLEGSSEYNFDLSALPTGIYFVKIKLGNQEYTNKLIIK